LLTRGRAWAVVSLVRNAVPIAVVTAIIITVVFVGLAFTKEIAVCKMRIDRRCPNSDGVAILRIAGWYVAQLDFFLFGTQLSELEDHLADRDHAVKVG